MADQVTCGCGAVTLERGRIVTKGYCHACNTLLEWQRGKPVVTLMVPRVDSDAVRATRLWQMLMEVEEGVPQTALSEDLVNALYRLGLIEDELMDYGKPAEPLTDDGRVILAALQQSALTPAKWLANVLSCEFDDLESCNDCQFRRSSRCPGVPDGTKMPIAELRKFCQSHIFTALRAAEQRAEQAEQKRDTAREECAKHERAVEKLIPELGDRADIVRTWAYATPAPAQGDATGGGEE